MSADYRTIYDAGVRVFQLAPAGVMLVFPIFILLCLYVGRLRRSRVPGRAKLAMWAGYALYSVVVVGNYWKMWQDQTAALNPTSVKVIEGRLADGWVSQKEHSKTTDIYQHFTVRGVEFLHHNRRRNFLDFLLPHPEAPVLPLIDGARVRIAYRGEGGERTILRFEIAPSDLSAD